MDDELPRGDRAFTYRVTFASLSFGVTAAVTVGLLLLSLRQPLTTNAEGSVVWSLGMFMVPLAGFISIAILAWSIFSLPVRLAKRRGVVLDPEVWPITGAVAVGILVIVGFVAVILFGVI